MPRPENGTRRNMAIYNGCTTKRGAAPWQVILEDGNCQQLCGGTQINLKFILTAAHCMYQFKKKPSELCPKNNVKKVIPYPRNIVSKYLCNKFLLHRQEKYI